MSPDHITLYWVDPESHKSQIYSFSLPVTIGRNAGNQIVLASLTTSGEHAIIDIVGDELTLTDNQSSNGTKLNDNSIEQATLQNGDKIEIGGVLLFVTMPAKSLPND